MGIDKIAIFIIEADPVRVPVCGHSQCILTSVGFEEGGKFTQIPVDRFGCISSKGRIVLAPEKVRRRKKSSDDILSRTVHGVVSDFYSCFFDRLQIKR